MCGGGGGWRILRGRLDSHCQSRESLVEEVGGGEERSQNFKMPFGMHFLRNYFFFVENLKWNKKRS